MLETAKANKVDKDAGDQGIEQAIEKLSPQKISRIIEKFVKKNMGARLKIYTQMCVHCGLCADACHYYISHDNDPLYSPVGKIKQTLWKIITRKGWLNPDEIGQIAEIAYTQCNLCKRCTLYCPFGIDIAYLLGLVRQMCYQLGVTPLYIQDTLNSHSATMNQMWVKDDEWIDTIQWQEEDARDEIPNLRIPLEKNGADIMYSVIAPEPKFQAELLYQASVLMHMAKIDWTVPATPGWDNSDMAMYIGDNEIMGRLKKVHFETAMALNVKKIVMGECGHAFRSVYDTGNRFLGWRMPPIPVVHAIEFYYDLIKSDRIKIINKYPHPVTLHDPCNISRGRGLHEKARYVLNAVCENFVEMTPNREHNFCCGAGGGVINCGPPFKKARMAATQIKAQQMEQTKAHTVITPCHNCHSGIEDIVHHYQLDMKVKFMLNLIYEAIAKE